MSEYNNGGVYLYPLYLNETKVLRVEASGTFSNVGFGFPDSLYWFSGDHISGSQRRDICDVISSSLNSSFSTVDFSVNLDEENRLVIAASLPFRLHFATGSTTPNLHKMFGFASASTDLTASLTAPSSTMGCWVPGRLPVFDTMDEPLPIHQRAMAHSGRVRGYDFSPTGTYLRSQDYEFIHRSNILTDYRTEAGQNASSSLQNFWENALATYSVVRIYDDRRVRSSSSYSVYKNNAENTLPWERDTSIKAIFYKPSFSWVSCEEPGSGVLMPTGSFQTGSYYTVGGNVFLTGAYWPGNFTIQNNSGDNLSITGTGSFAFSTPLLNGSTYSGSILTQPASGTATISFHTGTIAGANITNVVVSVSASATGSSFSNAYSVVFDGVNEVATGSYAITGTESGFPVNTASGSFSVSLWVFPSGTAPNTWAGGTGNETIIGVGNQGSGAGLRRLSWGLKTRDSVGTTLEFAFPTVGAADTFANSMRFNSPPVFSWAHFLLVYNGAGTTNATRAQAYLNGEAVLSGAFVGTIPEYIMTSSWGMSVGAQPAGRYGACAVDEVCVWNTALTQSHATALYNAGTPVDPRTITGSTNLIHYWRMGDGDTFPVIQDQISFPGITPFELGMLNQEASDITASVPPLGTITW